MVNKKPLSSLTPLPIPMARPPPLLIRTRGCDYKCAACEANGTYHCSCSSIYYCSGKCQVRDWAVHQHVHDSYVNRGERPTSQHRRAILFPETGNRPQFVWVKMNKDETESFPSDADLDTHFGTNQAVSDYIFDARISLNWSVRYAVQVFYRADLSGTNENSVIRGLNNRHLVADWRGPVLCVAFVSLKDENGQGIRVGEDMDCAVLDPLLGTLTQTSQVHPPPDAGPVAAQPDPAGVAA